MPIVEWSDEYNTGILDIDKEHRHLFALINGLYDKVEAGVAETSIKSTLDALVDYVNYHFTREESLMTTCNYKDLENHKAKHRKLERQVANFKKSYELDPQSFDMAGFMEFLAHWLQDHILRSDMAYIPCVQVRLDSIVAGRSGQPARSRRQRNYGNPRQRSIKSV